MHLAPCGVRRLAAAVCGRGSPRPLLVRLRRHGFLCVGARHAVPGKPPWRAAAHAPRRCGRRSLALAALAICGITPRIVPCPQASSGALAFEHRYASRRWRVTASCSTSLPGALFTSSPPTAICRLAEWKHRPAAWIIGLRRHLRAHDGRLCVTAFRRARRVR